MPVGSTRPLRPRRVDDRPGGLGEDGVGVDVAVAGERVTAGFAEQVAPACGLAQFGLELVDSVRSAGLSLSARAAISFLRAAAFAAFAISGRRDGEELLFLELDPFPGRVADDAGEAAGPAGGRVDAWAPLPTRKMCGNSTCQWKNRYWRVRSFDQILGRG